MSYVESNYRHVTLKNVGVAWGQARTLLVASDTISNTNTNTDLQCHNLH